MSIQATVIHRIYKYPVPIVDDFALTLPVGARVLSVDVQHGNPQLWALVDPDAPLAMRRFRLAGTGHAIDLDPGELRHVGTFQMHQGALVLHLFEVLP